MNVSVKFLFMWASVGESFKKENERTTLSLLIVYVNIFNVLHRLTAGINLNEKIDLQ